MGFPRCYIGGSEKQTDIRIAPPLPSRSKQIHKDVKMITANQTGILIHPESKLL